MKNRARKRFWDLYYRLPTEVQQQARVAYRRFRENPAHPGLNFHPLQGYPSYWSVRITVSYRAVCVRDGEILDWFWIGTHASFDAEFD